MATGHKREKKQPKDKPWKDSKEFREMTKVLGKNIRATRKHLGWTLDVAAERLQLDIAHLTRIERGTLNPTLWSLHRIAQGLGVKLRDLFEQPPASKVSEVVRR